MKERKKSLFVSVFLCFMFLLTSSVFAQKISGVVTDARNVPVERAEVSLVKQNKIISQTRTNAEGKFSLEADGGTNPILKVTADGFAPFEKRFSESEFGGELRIVLQPQNLRADVTVSITQTETRLSETPASVVVLTREILETTAAQSPDDALRQIAGFNLFRRSSSRTTNPTAQGANFRGLAGSGASRAAVLLDGLSLNDAFGGWTFWSRVPRAAVQQVEVLRGGASAFYGESALSGAVNFNISAPGENKTVLRFETSAGTQETFDGSFFGVLRRNGWTFDLAAESFGTDGYVLIPEASRGVVDTKADSRHGNLLFTVDRNFGDAVRVFARGVYFTENRENGTPLQYNQTRFRQISAGADFAEEKFGAFQLRAFLETQVYDQTFSSVSADRNSETLSRIQRVPSQASGARAFWSRSFSAHVPAASFEFRQVRGFSNETGFSAGRASSLNDAGGSQRTFSVSLQDVWRASADLSFSFGARYDGWENFDASSAAKNLANNQISRVVFPDRSESAFSPRLAALYRISRNVSFIASYAKSFRAPTLNELYRGFRVGNVNTLPNENLRAERADTFETGLNYTGFERKLNLRGNFFYTDVKNPVVSVTLAATPSLITRQRQNVGETRAHGVEIDAEYAPTAELKFSASYLFTDSRVKSFPANAEMVGKLLPQSARHQAAFQSVYRPYAKLVLSFQGRISGAQYDDDLNTLKLRPSAAFDVFASYKIYGKLEVFSAVENVFNTRYDIGLTPNRTIGAPRFARAGLRFDLQNK